VRAIVLLDGEPRFRPYPFALPLDGPVARAVADATRMLARTPGRFDGPIAFCHGIAPHGAVLRRAGRYSEAVVVFEEPSLAYRLGFALGVQLFVQRDDGQVLFQRRARSIGRDPLLWTASASGGLRPGEEPRFAILADAAEETGLTEDDLHDLRAIAVVANDDTGSALVVYHARKATEAEPRADEAKVAELRWAGGPAELGGQVASDALACWLAFEKSLARDAG
jgi:isopentenyldiphosphate isomerase